MRIFVSYARDDQAFALRLGRDLRLAGVDIWIDQLDIPPGVPWDNAVEAALKDCPVFAIILSPRSIASQNVLDEVHFAISKAKKILPVMYENCELPMRLARLQYIDFTSLGYDACLQACSAHLKALFGEPSADASDGAKPPESSAAVIRTESDDRLNGCRILWVDDNPRNNRYERQALEARGVAVHLALETESAATIAGEISFDLVISDMGRPPDPRAGYTLLAKLRSMKIETPYIIYAGSRAAEHREEAKRAGAIDCTNSPYDLMDLIAATVSAKSGQ